MMKRALMAAPISLVLMTAAPLAAQDDNVEEVMIEEGEMPEGGMPMGGLLSMFGEMFKVEPLTAEQETRIPAAMSVAEKMMPDGTMATMINQMFDQFMGPIFGMGPPPTKRIVNRGLGIYDLDLTDEQMTELATLIDPAWEEREKLEKEAVPKLMAAVMTAVEPSIRKGVAEAFAVRFDDAELGQLDAFFGTEVGAKFARESYAMAMDPRVFSKSFEALPQVMGMMEDLKSTVDQATADLPPVREFGDLSKKEKARVAELTGYSVEEIEEMLAAYAAEDAAYATAEAVEEAADAAEAAIED